MAALIMLLGHLDQADVSSVSGWARDTEDPARRIELEIYDGDSFVTRLVADRLRPDLAAAGVGDGHYGFWTPLPRDMFPATVHRVSVRFRDSGADLRNSPKLVYPSRGGIDDAFSAWFDRHIDNAAAAAAAPQHLAPLYALCVNALSRLMRAEARLAGADAPPPSGLDRATLPARLKAVLEKTLAVCPAVHVPVHAEPRLTIVLAAGGSLRETHGAIASLVASVGLAPYEMIVVDPSGSADLVLLPLLVGGGVRIIKTPQPTTIVEAYRAGLALARGERLVCLGRILSVDPRALAALSETLDRADGAAAVSPRLVGADGRIVEAGVTFGAMAARRPIGHREAEDSPRHALLRPSEDLSARAFVIDRATLASAGGLDGIERFGELGLSDLAFRLRRMGAKVLMQGFAAVRCAGRADIAPATPRARATFVARWQDALPAAHAGDIPRRRAKALVIDQRFPDPDRDAASHALLSHCESLMRLGFSVEFAALGTSGGDQRDRAVLAMRGIEPHDGSESARDLLSARTGQFDVIYLHRLPVAKELLAHARATQPEARILYSLADLHALRLSRGAALAGDEALAAQSRVIEAEELEAIRAADQVITHSSLEKEWIRRRAPEVPVLRLLWAQRVAKALAPFEARRGFCFLGSYDHAPNVDAVRTFLSTLWPRIRAAEPTAPFDIAGSGFDATVFAPLPEGVEPRGYVADLSAYLAGMRVMLAPLRFGAGVKGKVLMSLAQGLPCVMSEVAAEGLGLPGALRTLLVAEDDEAFQRKALRFHSDGALWQRASELALGFAQETLSAAAIDTGLAAALEAPFKPEARQLSA
jgi:hypothetical protein